MKAIAGVLVAGTVAGAVAVSTGAFQGDGNGPLASAGSGEPAPVNPYNGMQEREEVYEFTQKPAIKKEGDKWVITFASKGRCDATVAILDKDGRIVRHLASGVLGRNAPHPFQQNSLSQKLEWDGQTDDFKKAPAGCKVKVSLGLKAKFERNIAYDPYLIVNGGAVGRKKMLTATDPDGNIYLYLRPGNANGEVRAYGKDGKYLRTVMPPSAAELEKVSALLGRKVVTANWGDKSPVADWFGPFADLMGKGGGVFRDWATSMDAVKGQKSNEETKGLLKVAETMEKCVPGAKVEIGPCPAVIQEYKGPPMPDGKVLYAHLWDMVGTVSVDYSRELIYVAAGNNWGLYRSAIRFDGKTGVWDGAWKCPAGVAGTADHVVVGYDDLIYGRSNGGTDYGVGFVARYTQEGKMVPFKQHRIDDPDLVKKFDEGNAGRTLNKGFVKSFGDALMLLPKSDANHTSGFDVAPDGTIIASQTSRRHEPIVVFDRDGKLLSDNAVADLGTIDKMPQGDGVYMDRDGNIYAAYATSGGNNRVVGFLPDGQKYMEGLKCDWPVRGAGGSLIKFRGLGGKYPVGRFHKPGQGPADALKLNNSSVSGALWAYGGVSQLGAGCDCGKARFWLDRFARSWVQANQVSSVMLLDSNGNRIARLGRYGNADDTEADVKEGRDGLRFVWVRSICASDNAMYAADWGSLRILKAALSYAAEEELPLP